MTGSSAQRSRLAGTLTTPGGTDYARRGVLTTARAA